MLWQSHFPAGIWYAYILIKLVLICSLDYMLDEMERSLHDSLCVIKRTLESGKVVPGGGAVEAALSIYLENFATTLVGFHALNKTRKCSTESDPSHRLNVGGGIQGSREQLAIAEFAASMLVIPKTLATNAAKDSTDLVAKLRAFHNLSQTCA